MAVAEHLLLPDRLTLGSRRQGGPGGRTPSRDARRHGQRLTRELEQAVAVARRFRIVEGVDPGQVFKFRAISRINDNALAGRGLELLGDTPEWTYFVFSSGEAPRRLLEQLTEYRDATKEKEGVPAPGRSFFDLVEHIEPYGPEDRRGPGIPADVHSIEVPGVVDIIVWPSATGEEATRRLQDVRSVLDSFEGGEELAADGRPQLTVLRARVSVAHLEALLGLAVVELVRVPPTPFIEPSDWIARDVDSLDFDYRPGEPVGIIDDGIEDGHPLLAGVVASRRSFPGNRPWQPIGRHGTMVAGLATYGDFEDALRQRTQLLARGPLHEARVLEVNANGVAGFPTGVPLHQLLETAIRTLHREEGVRVFNISIGDREPYSGPHVGLVTEGLDRLIRELGLVLVVSAGNHEVDRMTARVANGQHALVDYPAYTFAATGRIAEPSPAALALSVGSLARSNAPQTTSGVVRLGDRAVADINELSPFSRTGPGAHRGIKPDLVDYGGNWVVDAHDHLDGRNAGVSVISLGTSILGRLFETASGTSFAAPRVARLAADVWTAYPDASANLVRALIGISCRTPAAIYAQFPTEAERLRAVGFGRPQAALALGCGGNRVVMYFDGAMQTDTVAIHPVPIPPGFTRGRSSRRIAVALAFDPPVRRQRREYLAGEMSFDVLRNVSPDEIEERYGRQTGSRVDLWSDRRRLNLKPGPTAVANSSLQVRTLSMKQPNPDDGDVYYVAVTHRPAHWAEGGVQSYALVVEIVDEDRPALDLYAEVQQRVRLPARLRVGR